MSVCLLFLSIHKSIYLVVRINVLGQVLNILVFAVFNIVFWTVALNHYYTVLKGLSTNVILCVIHGNKGTIPKGIRC